MSQQAARRSERRLRARKEWPSRDARRRARMSLHWARATMLRMPLNSSRGCTDSEVGPADRRVQASISRTYALARHVALGRGRARRRLAPAARRRGLSNQRLLSSGNGGEDMSYTSGTYSLSYRRRGNMTDWSSATTCRLR